MNTDIIYVDIKVKMNSKLDWTRSEHNGMYNKYMTEVGEMMRARSIKYLDVLLSLTEIVVGL